jgi:hypothetical protein
MSVKRSLFVCAFVVALLTWPKSSLRADDFTITARNLDGTKINAGITIQVNVSKLNRNGTPGDPILSRTVVANAAGATLAFTIAANDPRLLTNGDPNSDRILHLEFLRNGQATSAVAFIVVSNDNTQTQIFGVAVPDAMEMPNPCCCDYNGHYRSRHRHGLFRR